MLRGQRVSLRHVSEADLPLLIQVAGSPEMRGVFQATRMTPPQQIHKRYAENGFSSDDFEKLLICDASGAVIGDVAHFVARGYSSAREIGWGIYEERQRGQGYATEAAGLLVDYLFGNLPINRIECGMSTPNIASRRVAEKLGFTYEGRARGVLFVGGDYIDGEMFSLLRSEWAAKR